jgi:signal transduction histidine kinase
MAGQRMLVRPESATAPAFWLQVDELAVPGAQDDERLLHLIDVTAAVSSQREQITIGRVMSHKLRTPVGQIVAATELLHDGVDSFEPSLVAGLVDDVHAAACRLESLVDDVLHYLEAPSYLPDGAGLPLADLPQAVQALCAREGLAMPQVRVAEDAAGLCVPLNRHTLDNVLWQLLENAYKFHPSHAPQVEVSARRGDDGAIMLAVADDGISLSPQQLQQVWQPYSQIEKRFTGERAGAGLGLAMVATVVWSLGGECRMRNRDSGPGIVVELVLLALPREREVVNDAGAASTDHR